MSGGWRLTKPERAEAESHICPNGTGDYSNCNGQTTSQNFEGEQAPLQSRKLLFAAPCETNKLNAYRKCFEDVKNATHGGESISQRTSACDKRTNMLQGNHLPGVQQLSCAPRIEVQSQDGQQKLRDQYS